VRFLAHPVNLPNFLTCDKNNPFPGSPKDPAVDKPPISPENPHLSRFYAQKMGISAAVSPESLTSAAGFVPCHLTKGLLQRQSTSKRAFKISPESAHHTDLPMRMSFFRHTGLLGQSGPAKSHLMKNGIGWAVPEPAHSLSRSSSPLFLNPITRSSCNGSPRLP
jgi:hypothetical protein